jgi:Sushi repeat (SCR repeat)
MLENLLCGNLMVDDRIPFFIKVIIIIFFVIGEQECRPPKLENGWAKGEGDSHIWVGEFRCNPGYILLGTSNIKCRDGTWSSETPKCSGEISNRINMIIDTVQYCTVLFCAQSGSKRI